MDKFEALKELLASIEDDYQKAKGGNKAAGTRVRKALQGMRTTAADLRKEILEYRAPAQTG